MRETTEPSPLMIAPIDDDVVAQYAGTSIEALLRSHCRNETIAEPRSAGLLIITCMDARVNFRIPMRLAFEIRTAGANPEPVMPTIAFVTATSDLDSIVVVGHTNCAMCGVDAKRAEMLRVLTEREGWPRGRAESHADRVAAKFRIDDVVTATWAHAATLAALFPTRRIGTFLYDVEDDSMSHIAAADGVSTT